MSTANEWNFLRTAGAPPASRQPMLLTTLRNRGYLPHFDKEDTPQFITFRLADSLPKPVLQRWLEELAPLPPEEASAEKQRRIESYLDTNHESGWLNNSQVASLVQGALLHFDGERYDLHAWVLMPNHVHVLATLQRGHSLEMILHSWKSFTSKKANRILGRTGDFWQREYFDRAIRSEKHFLAVWEYIEGNPVKAGLCRRSEDWLFGSAYSRIRREDDESRQDVGGPRGDV